MLCVASVIYYRRRWFFPCKPNRPTRFDAAASSFIANEGRAWVSISSCSVLGIFHDIHLSHHRLSNRTGRARLGKLTEKIERVKRSVHDRSFDWVVMRCWFWFMKKVKHFQVSTTYKKLYYLTLPIENCGWHMIFSRCWSFLFFR